MKTFKKHLIGPYDEDCKLTLNQKTYTVTYTFPDSEMASQAAQKIILKKLYQAGFKATPVEESENIEELNAAYYEEEDAIIFDIDKEESVKAAIQEVIKRLKKVKDESKGYYECPYLSYGKFDEEGTFEEGDGRITSKFYKVVDKYPQLGSYLIEYVNLLDYNDNNSDALSILGQLAEKDKAYVEDFNDYIRGCDLNHPTEHLEYISDVIDAWPWCPETISLMIICAVSPGYATQEVTARMHKDFPPTVFDAILKGITTSVFNIQEGAAKKETEIGEIQADYMERGYSLDEIVGNVFPDIDIALLRERFNKAIEMKAIPTHQYLGTGNW